MTDYRFKRGDIVYVDMPQGDTRGSEQSGIRPALIIQNDIGNKYSPTVIVSFLTTRKKTKLPTHVTVDANEETGLEFPSTVLLEQIKTIDKSRITKRVGQVSSNMVECINRALSVSVGLTL